MRAIKHTKREGTRTVSALCLGSHTNDPCVFPCGKDMVFNVLPECEGRDGEHARTAVVNGEGTCGLSQSALSAPRAYTTAMKKKSATLSSLPSRTQVHHSQMRKTILPKDLRVADIQDEMFIILDSGTVTSGRLASLRGRLIHLFASCPGV